MIVVNRKSSLPIYLLPWIMRFTFMPHGDTVARRNLRSNTQAPFNLPKAVYRQLEGVGLFSRQKKKTYTQDTDVSKPKQRSRKQARTGGDGDTSVTITRLLRHIPSRK